MVAGIISNAGIGGLNMDRLCSTTGLHARSIISKVGVIDISFLKINMCISNIMVLGSVLGLSSVTSIDGYVWVGQHLG